MTAPNDEGVPRRSPRPRYQLLADELTRRIDRPGNGGPAGVPSAAEIARRYQVPLPTAQFARRALHTRLRSRGSPHAVPMAADAQTVAERVAGLLRNRILNGTLSGRLPIRPVLAQEYRVSVDTVSKAVRLLAQEGLLFGAARHGTYVLDQLPPPASDPAGQARPVREDRGLGAVVDLQHGHQP
ncbi:GntR family transcriptional regulator [Streptomyces sp. NPDC059708]|uniref:GntR family transcriptional regulator n=1 Tax=Streptomyces sp. NPDC059708 TaxID=3346916 RepID=UPI00369E9F32